MATLAEVLERRTADAAPELVESISKDRLRCYACGHECPIPDGAAGVCKVRFNRGGRLLVPWGYVGGVQCDPIEKKPFFHAHPGALAYSFGMLGCDLHCSYCQNWVTSQALRDPAAVSRRRSTSHLKISCATPSGSTHGSSCPPTTSHSSPANGPSRSSRRPVPPVCSRHMCPTATARQRVLEYIRPWIDLYKVDLKSFDDRHYRQLGGRIAPILETIRALQRMGIWLELVTLLIPGFNDSEDELTRLTEFVASVSPLIPWHVTAFHQDYRMQDPANTSAEMLLRAAAIARRAGLRYVYAGNLPGQVGDLEDTRCHHCSTTLIERDGYYITSYRVTAEGTCPACGTAIPGRWGASFEGQITSTPFVPGTRRFRVL